MFGRRRSPDPADVALAAELDARVQRAKEAEEQLQEATGGGRTDPALIARLRGELDRRLTEAIEAADAAYRVALGPTDGLKRVQVLNRAAKPAVRDADRRRRDLALVRSHNRMSSRDDLGVIPPNAVPRSVGTAPLHLATRSDH